MVTNNTEKPLFYGGLQVSNLTKHYKKVTACNDVTFHLDPGSVTVLLGPNGAGKSTIMKSIIGFLRYEGEIRIRDLPNKSPKARRILGYIPEIPALYPNLTVSEHLEFLARAYRLKDYKEYAEQLLSDFELTDKKKKFGDELSKGMQQKLNICLGLLPRPEVLLLDEPMIGLDPHAILKLRKTIEELRSEGKTLLISTHIIDSVELFWDRALIMQDGTIRANVTKAQLHEGGQTLEELFFRKALISHMKPYGEKTAVILSALMFGLFHGNFSQVFYAFFLGLLFGYVFVKTEKLRYSLMLHMIINFLGSVLAPGLLAWSEARGNAVPVYLYIGFMAVAFAQIPYTSEPIRQTRIFFSHVFTSFSGSYTL